MGIRTRTAAVIALVALGSIRPAVAASSASPEPQAVAPAPQGTPGDVLARVNGAAITRAEVERALRVFLAQNRTSHEMGPEVQKEAQEAALEQLVGIKLLYEKGRTLQIADLEKQASEQVAAARKKLPSEEAYRAALEANHLTENEALQIVRTDIVVANLLEREVLGKITVPEAQCRTFYQENAEKFTIPAGLELSHILIEVDPAATAQEKKKAKEKAQAVRQKLVAGADFAALAKAESGCPSKEEGGSLGRIEMSELLPEFEKATEKLKPGEISEVTETQFGYHVLKLVARHERTLESFDTVKERIEYYLKEKKSAEAIADYVAALKSKAVIKRGSGA